MNRFRRLIRAHTTLAAIAGAAVVCAVLAGAALFQPWRIFTSSSINEALPAVGASVSGTPHSVPSSSAANGPRPVSQEPVVVSSGTFESQEHATSGTALVLELPDGGHLLRLENLASSDGPDVKVWLSSLEAGGDWFKYRSGRYVDLGAVKATHGNHNYVIPAGTDLSGLTSVVLWCDRFSVAFGSAPLA
ncbi:Electron transfer DM13 [Arthrobacter sp. yr096]|uniref:DM13 domain-containing protein n=1 Tax=unclassified Arthrobacter TaxID=235627 RepID=UPI0008963CE4|nr:MULTISPECIES: DM13 domain-containing protein [unclassified Arthrobacter]SDW37272.1 Electron transfer DM13 [Arthrobacter sp. cf158]SEI56418.1 Electron transfer DM13 [Arthrobacter sp. yr096]